MSNRKVPYNWENVSPGDIISFRYKSKNKTSKLHTILVLNPSLITKGQKKVSTQLIGLKLEESNKIQLKITQKQIQIFEDLKELFANGVVEGDPKKKITFKRDDTKKSVYSTVKYKIKGGYVDVRCTIFSKEFQKKYSNVGSSLQVIAHSEVFIDWLRNEAYK